MTTGWGDLALKLDLPWAGRHRLISRAGVNCTPRGTELEGVPSQEPDLFRYFWLQHGVNSLTGGPAGLPSWGSLV